MILRVKTVKLLRDKNFKECSFNSISIKCMEEFYGGKKCNLVVVNFIKKIKFTDYKIEMKTSRKTVVTSIFFGNV